MLSEVGLIVSPSENKLSNLPQKQPEPPKKTARRRERLLAVHGWFWKLLLGVITLSGIGLVSLWPRIGIERDTSLNPHTPFAQLFYVENRSVYGIDEVLPHCAAFDVGINRIHARGFSLINPFDIVGHLAPSAKANVTCRLDLLFGNPQTVQNLVIGIWVTYKVPLIGWRRCETATFKGEPASDNTFVWMYRGAAPCPVPAN